MDETETVLANGRLTEEENRQLLHQETLELRGVLDELLRVHGHALGSKAEGVTRLLYENVNGIDCRWANNWKLDKAWGIHDELEADMVAYNEHQLNMRHHHNSIGFNRLFGGGEADVQLVVAHNVHENVGKIQEGSTSLLMFGPLTNHLDSAEEIRDESGLGRWSVMTVKGGDGTVTHIICGYNPCGNDKPNSNTVYQQHC